MLLWKDVFRDLSSCLVLADVLSEEAILKWYNEAHLAKGKSFFLEQMKKFVEWLKNAEEGEPPSALPVVFVARFSLPQPQALVRSE